MREYKVISRKSNLAQLQIEEVNSQLKEAGITISLNKTFVDTIGDKDKKTPLTQKLPADFFTREVDSAILNGEADFAVHSAKDLPYPLHRDMEIVALTKRADKTDSLVTANGEKLHELPTGAVIGTSSKIREKEILALRDDIEIKSIRGNIEERIAQVDNGAYDAVIIATCALHRLGLSQRVAEILPIETHDLQGHLAIVVKKGKPELQKLFSSIDVRKKYGSVILAGAGVGDADNVSLKVLKALEKADIVYYDALIASDLLEYINGELFPVGKVKGYQKKTQDETNALLYKSAIEGKIVVRLKGGDPLIFGRGAEESEYLLKRGADVTILPGITSASTAAATYNIPITMRAEARSLSFVTSHTFDDSEIEVPNTATIIYYMSVTKRALLQQALLVNGREESEKVAFVSNIGRFNEKVLICSIATMDSVEVETPAVIIIGDVVNHYRKEKRIIYTGLSVENIETSIKGVIVHYPVITTQAIDAEKEEISSYKNIVFTSKFAVASFVKLYGQELLKQHSIIAIGEYTKKELEQYGVISIILPEEPHSDSLVELLKEVDGDIFYPCSNISFNKIHILENVKTQVLYKTTLVEQPKLDDACYDAVYFSSPSTVDNFLAINEKIADDKIIYAIGKKTEEKLTALGYKKERIVNVQKI